MEGTILPADGEQKKKERVEAPARTRVHTHIPTTQNETPNGLEKFPYYWRRLLRIATAKHPFTTRASVRSEEKGRAARTTQNNPK